MKYFFMKRQIKNLKRLVLELQETISDQIEVNAEQIAINEEIKKIIKIQYEINNDTKQQLKHIERELNNVRKV